MSLYGTLASLAAARVHGKTARLVVWTAAAVLILAIGFSRVYLGAHYLTDVLAGWAAAAAWVSAVSLAADRQGKQQSVVNPQ